MRCCGPQQSSCIRPKAGNHFTQKFKSFSNDKLSCLQSNSAYEAIITEAGTAPTNAQASASTSERASAWLEATVNSGNALAEWADALAEIPADRGGGVQNASTLLERAEGR